MIGNENDIIEFETCIKDAFYLLKQAVDMVEDGEDHRKIITIRNLILNKVLVHEKYIHTDWLKDQVETAWEILDEYAGKQDAASY